MERRPCLVVFFVPWPGWMLIRLVHAEIKSFDCVFVRQKALVAINLVAYYCVGLPVGLLLAYKCELEVHGLLSATNRDVV